MIREHISEGHTILYEAPQRWGKTLSGVIGALDAYQHGRPIYSNIQLGFPHEPLQFNEMKLADGSSKYKGAHIFIDELNFYFGGRRSMTPENIEGAAFLLQQKKQGCNLTGTTHNILDLDVIMREHYDYLIQPQVFPAYPQPPIILKMVVNTGPLQAYRPPRTIKLDCRPFLGLYDSFAIYDPFKKKERPTKPKVTL